MGWPTFTLIILLAAIPFTSSSSVSFKQYGCESLFTTTIKNLTTLVTFDNIPLNISFQNQVSDFPVVISLPRGKINNLTEIRWEVSYESNSQNFTASVPATCCAGSTTPQSINCVDINITCSSSQCSLAKPWNAYNDFYKMNCKNCVCTYCHKGGSAVQQLFQVSLQQQDFVIAKRFPNLTQFSVITNILPADSRSISVGSLPSRYVLDVPSDMPWFRIVQLNGTTFIQNIASTDLPEMIATFYLKDTLQKNIRRFDIYFYPPIQCDVIPENVTSAVINETVILFFKCNKTTSRKLVYKVYNDHFEIRDGKLYIAKIVNGIQEVKLGVHYEGIRKSERLWVFNFTVPTIDIQTTEIATLSLQSTTPVTPVIDPSQSTEITTLSLEITTPVPTGPRVIRIAAELLTSNSVSLTCYTNYDVQSVTYSWFISNKPVTGMKTEQIFANNRSQETITVLNLRQYILQQTQIQVMCQIRDNKLIFNGKQSFDLNHFPDVQLDAPKRSPSYSMVKYSCKANISKASIEIRYKSSNVESFNFVGSSYTGNLTLVNDTKISCVGVNGDYKGITKEQIVYIFNANASSLNGVEVTMHSFNNITFTCVSESTFAETEYHWYLNGNETAAGIKKGMPGNQTFGYLTLTNIPKDSNVLVTCKWHYRHFFVDERSINTSLSAIPQVTLTSPNVSNLYSVVNYSCISNAKNADVHIVVVPLSNEKVSYGVKKTSYEGSFIIFYDVKIFCFAGYKGQRGIIQEKVVLARAVNASRLDGVGVTMHNFSSITFSCFTNRTALNVTYQWYLDNKITTTGISERTLGNKIYGYLHGTNLNQNARVKIACKLFYNMRFVEERSINISISSIPQVNLTSPDKSLLYTEVIYSCASSLKNADVYVVVVPLHHENISYNVGKNIFGGRFVIFYDMKIFCYANYNGQRGIIKENVVRALPGNASLLDGVDVKMNSFTNITYSCSTKRTSLNTTYQWRFNDTIIQEHLAGTLGNKIYGYLTLTNLNQNARVKITCRLFYNNIFVEEKSINSSIASFPQVSLTSPNVSSIYSVVNYSCVTNVSNADVYVAVVPLQYKNISYSVRKARYTGNFTIQQDMMIFCFANHNGQRGIIKQNVVLLKEVPKYTIQRITTTMHSNNNITFTCYTNSTVASITYEWYFNGSSRIPGIVSSVVQSESQSAVTLTMLPRNYFATITCRIFYRTLFMDDQNITTNIASIPQVTINSQNLSLSNSVVNYSCSCNIKNALVYATVLSSTYTIESDPENGNVNGNFTMVNDTKISCYAKDGNKRGIIKSKTVYLLRIPRFSILDITTTEQSANDITFTCHTNSSLTAVTYKWYFNNIDITTKMTQMMVNGTSQSKVTLSNLEEKDSDSITCEAFYQTLRIDKKKISTSVSSIPRVTIDVSTLSVVGNVTVYTCKSSVKNSTVYVTVEYSGSSMIYKNVSSYKGRFSMVNHTKISCYADDDRRRGLTTEKIVRLAKVKPFQITQIATTMHRIDNITFACYTNSSSAEITYKWYFKGSSITSVNKQELLKGQSVGFLTLSNLRPKDKGQVTCEAYFKILKLATKEINFSVSTIPQVKITSAKVANIDTQVPYKCESSVEKADVYVYFPNTKALDSARNRSSYNGEFQIKSDTKISCYSKHNLLQGPVVETTVFASEGKKLCEAETVENFVWPETLSEKKATVPCPKDFEGSVTRQCNKDGQWENVDQSDCANIGIIDAKADLEKISNGLSTDLSTPVKELATKTNTTLKKKELVISFEAITEIVEITEDLPTLKVSEITNFFEISSNLLNENKKEVWDSIDKKDTQEVDKTPQSMMKNVEKFATIASGKINKTLVIQKENLLVEIKKASVDETLKLPTLQVDDKTPVWIRDSLTSVTIPSDSLKEVFRTNETVSVATTIFKGVSGLLQGEGERKLNSYVLSLTFTKDTPINLSEPISLNFEHLLSNFSAPLCSFWDFNLTNTTGGGWSREGCSLVSSNSTFTICACTHLTNFAILMNPWIDVQQVYALRLITTIGCWISIVALVITILMYITCWKHVASRDVAKSRSVLLINLCLSLACVYLIFLFGIENTHDKGVCTAIAILLLYFLLVAFFSMLAEGIDIAIALTVVFTSDLPRLPWLIATSWLAPAVIVGISLGATKLEGFGNDKFCWLDRESGLIWALIVPVIAITFANIICCAFALRALMSAGSPLKHTTKPTTVERIKKGARAMLVLSPLLGFTWILGLFSVSKETVVFEYIFAILTTLQGFFIFLAYCLFSDQLRKAFTESKFHTRYLSTKQSTLSQSKTMKGSFDESNRNDAKSSYLSSSQPYESNKQKNIKRNADFNIKRDSDFDLKRK